MTAFQDVVFSFPGHLLRSFSLIILIGQIAVYITCFRENRLRKFQIILPLQLLFGILLTCFIIDGSFSSQTIDRVPLSHGCVVIHLYSLPWLVFAAVEILALAAMLLSWYLYFHDARKIPGSYSIKLALDMLPEGICISSTDGTPLLQNLKMSNISRQMTKKNITNTKAFSEHLHNYGMAHGDDILIRLDNGSIYLFSEQPLKLDGQDYLQLTASDMTEQYRLIAELEEKQLHLQDMQDRIKSLGAQAVKMAADQEILNARIAVHDEIGTVLLTGKYFFDHPELTDRATLYQMMKNSNRYLMKEAEGVAPEGDPVEDSVNMAETIGVSVVIEGDNPSSPILRDLLGNTIRQCVTNTIKHADGDRVSVKIERTASGTEISVTNNGTPPAEPVCESGGLASLRLAVEAAGGTMTIDSEPQFLLTLFFPNSQ